MAEGGGSLVTIQGEGTNSFQYPKVYDATPITPSLLAMMTLKVRRLHIKSFQAIVPLYRTGKGAFFYGGISPSKIGLFVLY
jgi:hypothetical protein